MVRCLLRLEMSCQEKFFHVHKPTALLRDIRMQVHGLTLESITLFQICAFPRLKGEIPKEKEKSMSYQVKICPRCGEGLFQDMGVCYDCLFDFCKKKPSRSNLISKVPFVDTDNRSQSNQEDFYTQVEADEIGKQWDEGLPPAVIEEMAP